jgi:hypothetical protein
VLEEFRSEEVVLGESEFKVATVEELGIDKTAVLEMIMLKSEIMLLLESTLTKGELRAELITAVELEREVLLGTSTGYEDVAGVEIDSGTTLDEVSRTNEALLDTDVAQDVLEEPTMAEELGVAASGVVMVLELGTTAL